MSKDEKPTSRARILFDDPSRSAGSENEAQRKGYAVKFAKVERRTQGKGADYFQKWRTITQTGVLPRRRGCGLFPKLTDFFFGPESGSALLFLTTDNSTPFGTI